MLKPRLYVVVLAVLLLVVSALARVTTNQPKDKTESLKSAKPAVNAGFGANGLVLDDSGKPIRNVKVYALWESMDTHGEWCIRDTAISDKNGQFAFNSLPWLVREREYILIAHMHGRFVGETSTRIYRNVGSRNHRIVDADLVIQLRRLRSYMGRVVDQKGRGLSQVTVQPIEMIAGDQWFRPEVLRDIMEVPDAVTDAHGNYKLVGVPDGSRLVVKTTKSGYSQYPHPYESNPDRVVMIASARVRIYKHKVLPGETYRVEYKGLGLNKYDQGRGGTVKVSKDGVDRVDLHLQKVPTAVGYITDQFGLPIQDANVSLPGYGPVTAVGPFYGAAMTGSDGKFAIGISPMLAARTSGSILVYAYHGGRHLARFESVEVKTLLGNGLKLSLRPVSTLRVTVIGDGNKPVNGATVYITPEFPGRGSIETDSHGHAVFDVCPGIKYDLAVENHYGKKRYPHNGKMPAVGDKDWKSEVRIELH